MSTRSKIGPNDPCPCGSSQKYKRCCMSADRSPAKTWKKLVLGALLTAGAVAFVLASTNRRDNASSANIGFGPGTNASARPAGQAPAGRVWSPEHGHWHNAQ